MKKKKRYNKETVQGVIDRSGGICEVVIKGLRCPRFATEIHHIIKRSKGGKDTIDNMMAICHYHHDIIHRHFFEPGQEWTKPYIVKSWKPKK